MKSFTNLYRLLTLAVVSLTLAACSGSSSSPGNDTASGSGAVGILLTDKPADPGIFLSINASIEAVSLIGDDDGDDDDDDDNNGGHVVLFDGPTQTIDLLRLRHESIPLTYADNVPAGEYCKIRLTLSDLELVLADDTPDNPDDNETYHPKLPGNGKLDLKIRDCMEVGDGDVLTLEVDLDAGKSIHIVDNKKGFNFRPVIFVNLLDGDFDPKLVRVEGVLSSLDDDDFLLCDAIPMNGDDSDGCVEVSLLDISAFFDNLNQGGAPRPFSELFDDDLVGEQLTVIGWPRHLLVNRVDVPDGHLPPAGECRLWHVGLDAGLQPAPIDCDDVPDELPDGTVLVTHDGLEDHDHIMELDALVVELGDFLQVEGEVETDADSSGFSMNLADGSPISSADPLLVALQDGGIDYNGTRIISKSGELLETTDIVVPLPVQVDGVLEVLSGSDAMLKAALIIVDMEAMDADPQITGIVTALDGTDFTVDPDEDMVCGITTDAFDIVPADDVKILSVVITGTGSTVTPGGSVAVDSAVGLSGSCGVDSFIADTVVIVDDQR